ncbi:hypothetical protein EPO05_00295 [Patescibacteria group bacterium]|nr:MAG: hypothetical protein EPO05_00295 [Patescibacteria group bacterium]
MKERISRAIVSVSNKTGLIKLGKRLEGLGIQVISTGGTARELKEAGVLVTQVSDYSGFPEILRGRLKTLNPRVMGGIIGEVGVDDAEMQQYGIQPIPLVFVNFYLFEEETKKPGITRAEVIEKMDVGGPTMVRAAAKNGAIVVVDPEDYDWVVDEIERTGDVDPLRKWQLAQKVFELTSAYDAGILEWLEKNPPKAA